MPLVVAGVVVVAGCGLTAAQVAARAGDRVPVLAAARSVQTGQVITRGDVRVVRVAADPGAAVVPAGRQERVVGRTAAVSVPAGGLLAPAGLGPARMPPEGYSVVGLAMKPGRYPAGLRPGAQVRVVFTSGAGERKDVITGRSNGRAGDGQAAGGSPVRGTVLSVGSAGPNANVTVSVQVSAAQAAGVATAAASDAVGLVEDSNR